MADPTAPLTTPTAGAGRADAAPARGLRTRRGRVLVALAAVVLLALPVAAALLGGSSATTPLDPGVAAPQGSRAVAELLRDQGVPVERVDRSAAALQALTGAGATGTTLVVTDPDLLAPDRLAELADAADAVVLLAPGPDSLAAVTGAVEVADPVAGLPADPSSPDDAPTASAGCTDPAAEAAGTAASGGLELRATGDRALTCFDGSYAVAEEDGRTIAVLSQSAVVSNARLDEDGDAALALRALGTQPRVVWLMASPLDAAAAETSPGALSLLPGWVRWVGLQLVVVAVLLVIWRARRMGALVGEPLPVVVRSVEAVEGRAALYRAAQDRAGTARVLRAAALQRCAERSGLPMAGAPEEVVRVVADATGRDSRAVRELLLGADPRDDAELVALARALRDLPRPARAPTS